MERSAAKLSLIWTQRARRTTEFTEKKKISNLCVALCSLCPTGFLGFKIFCQKNKDLICNIIERTTPRSVLLLF